MADVVEVIFCENVHIRIKQRGDDLSSSSPGSSSTLAVHPQPLQVQIALKRGLRSETNLMVGLHLHQSKSLRGDWLSIEVRITDERDPFFHYSMELTEDAFSGLKRAQDILVDFSAFPSNIIELLRRSSAEVASRYLVELEIPATDTDSSRDTTAVLSLIETNSFKNLVHLSLSLTAGNDAAIKQYLAGCLRTEKAEAARLRADLEASAANLAMAEAATKTAVVAEAAAKAELGTLGERLSAEHAADALAARGAAVQAQAELQERAAAEARAREDRVNAQVSAAEQRVNELATSNAALTERCHSAEASLAEASAKAAASAAMSASLTADLAAARQESRGLATAKHEAQNEINSNRIRIAELAQQVRGKDEVAQQQSQLLAVGGEQRTLLEAALRESETQRTAAEQARAATALELSAARQQVSELQEEVRAAEKKVSSRGEVLVRQERVLESKIDELEAARGQVVAAEAAATASETEKAHLQQALDKATAEAAERTRMLEKSENIITWLNRQLNDKETVAARSSRHTLAGNRSLSPLSDSGAGSSESVAGSPPEKATDKSSTGRPLQVPPAGSMLEARRAVAPFGNSAANSSNRSGPVRYTAQKPSGGGSIHSAYSEYGLKLASTASSKPDALAKYLPESVSGTSAVASSSAKSKIPTKAGRLMGEGIEPSVAAKSPEPTMKAASPSPHADTDLDRSIETCDKSIDADALIRDALAVINS